MLLHPIANILVMGERKIAVGAMLFLFIHRFFTDAGTKNFLQY